MSRAKDLRNITATGTSSEDDYVLTYDDATKKISLEASGGGASAQTIDIKTADYTVVSADLGKIIKYVGGTVDRTVTLTAGATLGDGFFVTILNANTGADERVVINANGIEKFGWQNGPGTITLSRGELIRIIWDNTSSRWIIGEGGFNLAMRSDINPATSSAAGDGANGAIALGMSASATGSVSVAIGQSATASGTQSIALGYNATASYQAIAGPNSNASGGNAVAFGIGNNSTTYGAKGDFSFATGINATAAGDYAMAMGYEASAAHDASIAIGRESTTSSNFQISIGNASNIYSEIKTPPIRIHSNTVNVSTTIASTDNAISGGPVTIANGVTVTVSGDWTVV